MKISEPMGTQYMAWGDGGQHASLSLDPAPTKTGSIRISLKQWRMFHAVVDCNGFAEAAEKLHVSQSSISHALAKLQEQLSLPLLILKGRKAHVTDEGKILLERSRGLVRAALELEELAENLRQGWGPELRLAIDHNFPSELLMHALCELSSSARKLRLSVHEANAEQASHALHEDKVDFAVSTEPVSGFVSKELIAIEQVAVAHPDNPLFALRRELTFDDLKKQPRVTVTGCNDYILTDADQHPPQSSRQWNVSTLDRAVAALAQGLGYAWLPKQPLQRWFDGNVLRILPIKSGSSHTTCLHLVFGRSVMGLSSAMKFADALRSISARIEPT
ncbi:MAG: LysR family transcriptional regulator [Oxalobacteraceae bacterium]|nr:MAG: LysR family transcriptional regulator [Oxalobacteraceae bacterium]